MARTSTLGMTGVGIDVECPADAEICAQQISEHLNETTVFTSGTATVKVKPDMVTITVGVETDGATAQEAAAKNAELMEKVIAALKELGISEDQISTAYFNVYPVYDWRSPPCIEIYPQPPECNPKNEIIGYKATNSVSVTMEADEDAGQVIDTAIEAGANNVSGVYFFVSTEKQQEIRDGLIKGAIANARHRADVVADALEMEVSGVQSVSLNDVYFPIFYSSKDILEASDGSTQILPGEQEISTTVSVTFLMS